MSLAAILGVPADYPPLALLQEDPAGTASFLVDEISSLAMSVLKVGDAFHFRHTNRHTQKGVMSNLR